MQNEQMIEKLNGRFSFMRLHYLKKLQKNVGHVSALKGTGTGASLNWQSKYSFGPYTPSLIVYKAYRDGEISVGITDFLSLKGVKEFHRACEICGLYYLTGYRINARCPSTDNGYVVMSVYGVPKDRIKETESRLAPLRTGRYAYVKKMTQNVNKEFNKFGIKLNFDRDVIGSSSYFSGGSVADKHVFFALAKAICKQFGKGENTLKFVEDQLKIDLKEEEKSMISDDANPFYEYDLARVLKTDKYSASIKSNVFTDEEAVIFAHSHNSIATYEVKSSKVAEVYKMADRAEKTGVDGIAFSASKFSAEEVEEICKYLVSKKLVAVDLEVIDEPRKKNSVEIASEYARNVLYTHAKALIGHEIAVSTQHGDGFNSAEMKSTWPSFEERIQLFANIAQKGD